jgi:hypothetical protein
MNYLLDTNHWSHLQRNHSAVVAHIRDLPDEAKLYMPVIAQAELLVGVTLAASEQRKRQLQTLYEQVVAKATDNCTPIRVENSGISRACQVSPLIFCQRQRASVTIIAR